MIAKTKFATFWHIFPNNHSTQSPITGVSIDWSIVTYRSTLGDRECEPAWGCAPNCPLSVFRPGARRSRFAVLLLGVNIFITFTIGSVTCMIERLSIIARGAMGDTIDINNSNRRCKWDRRVPQSTRTPLLSLSLFFDSHWDQRAIEHGSRRATSNPTP